MRDAVKNPIAPKMIEGEAPCQECVYLQIAGALRGKPVELANCVSIPETCKAACLCRPSSPVSQEITRLLLL